MFWVKNISNRSLKEDWVACILQGRLRVKVEMEREVTDIHWRINQWEVCEEQLRGGKSKVYSVVSWHFSTDIYTSTEMKAKGLIH